MRWKTPSIGNIRTRSRFAWLPERMDNDVKVWLEFYRVHEIYRDGMMKRYWDIMSRTEQPRGGMSG